MNDFLGYIAGAFLSILPLEEPLYLTLGEAEAYYQVQIECMADNVYHEARNQGTAGQLAVMAVTMNRVHDDRFPNDVCGVVKEGPHRLSWKGTGEMIPIRHKCQFSWYCDGKSDTAYDQELYEQIYTMSEMVVTGQIELVDITDGATHYHADYVRPAWASTKTKTIEIEDHIFYRWD